MGDGLKRIFHRKSFSRERNVLRKTPPSSSRNSQSIARSPRDHLSNGLRGLAIQDHEQHEFSQSGFGNDHAESIPDKLDGAYNPIITASPKHSAGAATRGKVVNQFPNEQQEPRRRTRDVHPSLPPTQANNNKNPAPPPNHQPLIHNAAHPPSLTNIVNLNNTTDTTISEHWAPATTHETINRNIHRIREEHISREIHTHDIHHRILPIIDIEVLPPRHFVPSPSDPRQLVEVEGKDVPGRRDDGVKRMRNWFVARTGAEGTDGGEGPRRFTAREFGEAEGVWREWVGEDGVERSVRTWVHAPVVETGARETGQTVGFHFGSGDGLGDGFRE
ncbi:MAG: hypothetical protein M1820_003317 [Bogoriella megaspora]|nr:MAG: hypothetical protein M1820_003317 [Bogoriella megaspora]